MQKFMLLFLLVFSQFTFGQDLVINEVMSSNSLTLLDEDGDASDWIEIFNGSSELINLNGYYVSDDSSNLMKWKFGDYEIGINEYTIIFASNKDTSISYFHTNFKIDADGEEIFLSDLNGLLIDKIYVPSSLSDFSYGRNPNNTILWNFQNPTPGSVNSNEEITISIDTVTYSLPAGFYPSSISIELSANNSRIFYTTDGSDPDNNSTEYSTPISVNTTTVIKSLSINQSGIESHITHKTYFINENTDLPVISISTNPDNFFDSDSGIYIHYEEDWERAAHVEFYDDNKTLGFSENVGINIYGGYTRRFAQKSLAVKFKSKYGKNKLKYDLFPGFRLKEFKSFILRNSGNDFDQTHIRDAFMQTLIKDLDIDYLEYRPAVTFINGEYWGIYNIREKISEHYVANRHEVDPDNIDMMEGYSAYNDDRLDPDGEYRLWVGNINAIHGDTVHYKQLIDYLNDEYLTTDAAYEFLDSMIDLDECLLYYAAQVYFNSQDWPANNSKYWRERTEDGKWRWIIYDLDFGFNLYEFNNEGDWENHVTYLFSGDPSQRPWSKPVESTFIPRKIVKNPKIENQFVNQVADLLNTNFKSDRVLNIMNDIKEHIADDIERHRSRFGVNGDYNSNINRMISFANNRPNNLRNHVRNFFRVGEDANLTVDSDGRGSIIVNSITLSPNELPWTGTYYQDNAIHLSVIPEPGYKFDGWSGTITSEDAVLEISSTRTISLTASFSLDTSVVKEIVINEINYNSANDFNPGDWVELFNITDTEVDLSGWYLSDSNDDHKYYFPSETKINAGEYLVIVEDDSLFSFFFSDVENYLGETGFGFNGSGELIRLFNSQNQIIDSLTYDDTSPWPIDADGLGSTLELYDAMMDNAVVENWSASYGYGTPGRINSILVSVEDDKTQMLPKNFRLSQNYPNPFNPTTTIKYSLPVNSHIKLSIYDILGREIDVLVDDIKVAGTHKFEWNASNFSSGIYFYKITVDNFVATKKLILVK